MRRAPGRILAGLWQCVSGSLEPGETVVAGALRELREETGYDAATIEAFFSLDQVNQFHEPTVDAILTAAVFAARVEPDAEPVLSHEHDDAALAVAAGRPGADGLAGLSRIDRPDRDGPRGSRPGGLVPPRARRPAAGRLIDWAGPAPARRERRESGAGLVGGEIAHTHGSPGDRDLQ